MSAKERWIEALMQCPRISYERHGHNSLPIDGCECADCELWRKAERLHDEYRRESGLPV